MGQELLPRAQLRKDLSSLEEGERESRGDEGEGRRSFRPIFVHPVTTVDVNIHTLNECTYIICIYTHTFKHIFIIMIYTYYVYIQTYKIDTLGLIFYMHGITYLYTHLLRDVLVSNASIRVRGQVHISRALQSGGL